VWLEAYGTMASASHDERHPVWRPEPLRGYTSPAAHLGHRRGPLLQNGRFMF